MAKELTREVSLRFIKIADEIMGVKQLTQNQFADSVSMTSSNLIRIEKSEDNNVSIESLCLLIQLYKVSPVWLLTGQGVEYVDIKLLTAETDIKVSVSDIEAAVTNVTRALGVIKSAVNKNR